jgi:CubicO group peptidase (beta-lactamase class C family)
VNRLADPELVHVTADRGAHDVTALKEMLRDIVSGPSPTGLSIAVLDADGLIFSAYGGQACRVGTALPVTRATSYDLASLTKVVCSVTLTVVLARSGLLSLEDPVEAWLPEFPRSGCTLMNLLTHTSGLVDHRPFFEHLSGRRDIASAVIEEATRSAPTGEVLYSDLNFMLLGWVLEACGGDRLDHLFADRVTTPLGMEKTVFGPVTKEEAAATELDGDQRLTPGLVWGEVHDGNAYALGGVAGHAGLFAPLDDLVSLVRQFISPDGRVLTADALDQISSRRAGRPPDIRGLGWRLEPESWGDWPQDTLWHTGFTGTSLLVSRPLGLGVVLLTNAIHPHRRIQAQAEMRAAIHRLVSQAFT